MDSWTVRRASLRDRDALAGLCRQAVGPDDYVLEILDDLILREVTYVALDSDRVIGMTSYQELPDGSAWLFAARTHPAFRRRGVASDLAGALEALARAKGLRALRLWSEASNPAAVATFAKAGFREVARFTRMLAPAASGLRRARLERVRLTEDVWRAIETSEILEGSRSYTAHRYVFLRMTRSMAHYLANQGALWGWHGNGVLLFDAAETFPHADELEMSPLFGDLAAILRMGPRIARSWDKARVAAFLRHDPPTLGMARGLGYRLGPWGREAILCEKPLAGPTIGSRRRRTYAELHAARRSGYAALALLAPGHGHGPGGPHGDRWNP